MTTIPATAARNRKTSRPVLRRATSWCSKKSIRESGGRGFGDRQASALEGDFRRGPLDGGVDLEEWSLLEAERSGDLVLREALAVRVVAHHGVVVRLAGERDPVLGGPQLLLERLHVLIRLEVGV